MIQAIVDKVVVQLMRREVSKGGIIMPESVQEPQSFGRVISIGEKVEAPIEEGHVVMFHTNGGMAMIVEGKVLKCLMENELYGIVKDTEILESLELCEVKQKDLEALDKEVKKNMAAMRGDQGQSRIIKV